MLHADPLSRRPDHEEGVINDNQDKTLLHPEFFTINTIAPQHASSVNDAKLLDMIKKALEKDKVTQSYRELLRSGPQEFGKDMKEWNFENSLLLHRGKVYMPKDMELCLELLKLHHDTLLAGHPG
jgi:hypothetical protein